MTAMSLFLLPADRLCPKEALDLAVSEEGEIWVAFDAAPNLLVYRDGEWYEVETQVDEPVSALLIDSQGNLWAGYSTQWASDDSEGLLHYNGETWEQISEWPGIVTLAEDRHGRIWVGGRHGLSVYDPHWDAEGR
jgi:ligand-binding sensor domain-containing protein